MLIRSDDMPKELRERIINAYVNADYFIHIPYNIENDMIINKVMMRCEIKLINHIQFQYGFELVNREWELKAIIVLMPNNIAGGGRIYYRKTLDDNDFERIVKVMNGMKKNKDIQIFLRRRCFERTGVFYSVFDLY